MITLPDAVKAQHEASVKTRTRRSGHKWVRCTAEKWHWWRWSAGGQNEKELGPHVNGGTSGQDRGNPEGDLPQPDQEYHAGDDATSTEDRKRMPVQKLDEQAAGTPEQRCQQQKGDGAPVGSLHCRHFNSC